MMKTIAAVAAGVLLVASQAAATTQAARVGDRIGAPVGSASQLAGISEEIIFIGVTIAAFAIITTVNDDDSESD